MPLIDAVLTPECLSFFLLFCSFPVSAPARRRGKDWMLG